MSNDDRTWNDKKMSKYKRRRLLVGRLRALLASGYTIEDAQAQLGVSPNESKYLQKLMYKTEVNELQGKSTEQIFVDYLIAQRQNLRDLDSAQKLFKGTRQFNAVVGAIKVKSEILNGIIQKGQELGFFDKAPDKLQVIGGVALKNLSSSEMEGLLRDVLSDIRGLTSKSHMRIPQAVRDIEAESVVVESDQTALPPYKRTKRLVKD